MSPKYKVTYFNVSALGEPIRYLLAYGKCDFEDNRIQRDDWPKLKPDTPFGKLPMLEVDGKKVHQHTSICRYLAKQVGLAGDNDWEALEADIIVDTLGDMRQVYSKRFQETDEKKKEELTQHIVKEHHPFYLGKFEEMVKTNKGHFVNGKMTWADIYFSALSNFVEFVEPGVIAKYPSLNALIEKVHQNEGIKAYLANKPKSDF